MLGPWKIFKWPFSLSSVSGPGVHSVSTGTEYQGISFGGKVRPEPTADSSAPLNVSVVEVRMEDQHFLLPLILREF